MSLKANLLRLGNFFFRNRSLTPIPLILFLAICRWRESSDSISWMPGLALLALGEAMRLWGVAVVGKESRTRGSGTARLVAYGPYAYVRNPLYLGNLLLTVGATLISELLWALPFVLALFIIQYVPIVLWEESILTERFGETYASYCRRVPRWFPRFSGKTPPHPGYQWRASFRSERSTLGTLALLMVFMLAKENLPHLPKYIHKHSIAFSAPKHSHTPSSAAYRPT